MAFSLIIGGAASGKSAYAESVVEHIGKPSIYLATARPNDSEMRIKIDKHKMRRSKLWKTIEEPLAPHKVILSLKEEATLLLDCITLWLFNISMTDKSNDDIKNFITKLTNSIKTKSDKNEIFVVTNDLSGGLVPADFSSRKFQILQGHANQELAKQADNVINVIAGIPLTLKGELL